MNNLLDTPVPCSASETLSFPTSVKCIIVSSYDFFRNPQAEKGKLVMERAS